MKNLFISDGKIKTSNYIFNFILVTAVLSIGFYFALLSIGYTLDFAMLWDFRIRIVDGYVMTILLSISSLVTSLIIGVLVAFGANCKVIAVKIFCDIYVKIIRGTPLIMQIYLFYYIIGTALGVNNRFLSGVIILSVFEGAYIAEIIRGSLISIEGSQLEVAKSVGFTKKQIFTVVIIPQLISRTLPSLTGQFASIIKDSSLLSIIAVIEIMQTMREITATNLKMFEAYFFLGLLYLLLTLPLSLISEKLERRFNYANQN